MGTCKCDNEMSLMWENAYWCDKCGRLYTFIDEWVWWEPQLSPEIIVEVKELKEAAIKKASI